MSISINRLTEAWFEFKGVRSDSLDIYMTQMPVRQIPARDLIRTKVAARSGALRLSDGSYDDITVAMSFKLLNPANRNAVNALLTGSGKLRFSDEPDLEYDAVIEEPPQRQFAEKRYDAQAYDVTFVCAPFKTLHTPADNIVKESSGGTFTNPGTAPALPRVKITGSGTFSVTIGMTTMFFVNVTGGGIIVDSELGDALTFDGALLANECIGDSELFVIQPGLNAVSWIAGEHTYEGQTVTGTVTKVEITPRWRYI